MKAKETAQKWSSAVNLVTIGASRESGGTRSSVVTLGGSKCAPWLAFEGDTGKPPAIAVEIWDVPPDSWADEVKKQYGSSMNDPAAWAVKAAQSGADLICLRLMGTHPDLANKSADNAASVVKAVLKAVGIPLIIWGCGVTDKDNVVLPKCSEAAKGENCLFGSITEKNYRTLVASCLADGHKIVSESPLDINIAKQVNILAHDAGYPLEDLVIYPTSAAMGYGFEYVYSIMERARLAGLGGDPLLRQPLLCDVGIEAWRAKEAQVQSDALGPASERGPMWETLTATNYMQSGANLIILRHLKAVSEVKKAVARLSAGASASA